MTRIKQTAGSKRVVRKVKKEDLPVTPIEDVEPTPSATPGGTRKRREVNLETVDAAFVDLCEYIEVEITRQRELKDQNGGRAAPGGNIKFLRSALKRTKQLQGDVHRVSRKKKQGPRKGNKNSGFLKEAPISDELADFFGRDHGSKMCRVDCTKEIHKYIMDNNLQNQENRRQIFPDKKLTKLLNYKEKEHGPLYYYTIQKLIQQHFN